MAVILPNSVFYHIPKTGGGWIREVFRNACLVHKQFGEVHATPLTAPVPEGRFSFTFVRHPCSLLQSYWVYCMLGGWPKEIDNFQEFMWRSLEVNPGRVSRVYRYFVGENQDQVDFIGRQESLTEDLIVALHLAGEDFEEEYVRDVPLINTGACMLEWAYECRYTPELRRAVVESEKWAMEKFGYE